MPLWIEIPVGLLSRLLYRVRVLGAAHIPASGGAVVIANHLSYMDVVVLQMACPRPLRFMAYRGPGTGGLLDWIYRTAKIIPISPHKPSQWLRDAVRALRKGELVCVFPEGEISRTGQLMALRKGFELMARTAKVPVIPVSVDGLWGSLFSFSGNRYLWKAPRLAPTPVCVAFGEALPGATADGFSARKALMDLGVSAMEQRPALRGHVGFEAVRSLAGHPGKVMIIDRTSGRRVLTAAQLIAAAAIVSRRLRRTVPEKRVGIVLPPGAGAAVANLAVICAGKVPVNLNFTAGRAAAASSIRDAELKTVLSAEAMRSRVPDFPWPERTVDLRAEIESAGGKWAMIPWVAAAWLLPGGWVARLMGIPRRGDRAEAALLFTSGSAGTPKGVVLSHRNLLANCAQISATSVLPLSGTMLGCLPVFHSFGFTFTLFYPLLRGIRLVTTPSPLETRAVVECIREEGVTVLLGAPTFIRPLLRKARPADLKSLDLVVTGAEKLPEDLRRDFLERFHLGILQGYGLTETSPVSNINMPNPPVTTATADEQLGGKIGSVGRLLPGMSLRIVHPDTGAELPVGATGLLLLQGPNIFSHYLGEEGSNGASLRDGWLVTWDLARIDEEGFVTVEGRLARFSKMGGEMVPHGAVEQKLAELWAVDPAEAQAIVVVGVPDGAKGEALVVLTTLELSASQVRQKLSGVGFPNLWIPRRVTRVAAVPLLATGKLDLAQCRRLAAEPIPPMNPQKVLPADIVDAHIHLYAAEAAADPRGWGRLRGETGWVNCVAPEGRRSLQGWADPEALMADMDAAGVSACVMLGWYWQRQETCDLQNKWYAEWVRRYPRRLFAFAAVQPAAGNRALESLERALDSGLCGIGELLPQAQGFAFEDPSWRAVAELAARRRIPITLHVTDPQAPAAAGPRTALAPYLNTAREFPTVPFILAHWGGGAAIRGLAEDQSLPPNLYFDTAASPLLYDRNVFRRAVDRVGPGRILYGSDYPLLLYPRTEARPGFRRFLDEVAASGLSAEEARQVLGANVRGLLSAGLAPAPKPV